MQLTIINSNSEGNAYILHNEEEALLLECGVNFKKIKEALNFNLSKVVGCLVTHEHGDHAKSITDVMAAGINVYASGGTHKALATDNHHRAKSFHQVSSFNGARSIDHGYETFNLDNFTIKPYRVHHDVAEPVCFLIRHHECGTVLFLTDTFYCEYKFKGLNNIIIEANYSQEIIDKRLTDGTNPLFLRDRVLTSHMSLDTCKKTLKAYDLSAVNNIVLIHLSKGNSNENQFKKEVEEVTGKTVWIANAGMTIDFNKQPF